jgi:4-amino-4-deoxy-L-arabinose transferase-like glycosyltransferase
MFTNTKNINLLAITIIISAFLIKFGAAFYLFNNNLSLFVDEAQYWLWSKNLDWGYYSKPPLIAFIINIFTCFFGDNVIALKVIPNVCIAISAWFIFCLTSKLKSKAAGIISLITFLFMPIVVFGSFFVTTDLPLIMFWCIALYALHVALNTQSKLYWLLLGILGGLGLLTKYAFGFFYICLFLYLIIFDRNNLKLSKTNILLSLVVTLIVISPNIYWNIENGFITLKHVAKDNIEISNRIYNPINGVKFLIEQIGILGLLNFIILAIGFYKKLYKDRAQQFLLCFSLPVFIIILIQAIVNQANANWAAPAFISLSMYIATVIDKLNLRKLFISSIFLNFITFICFVFGSHIINFLSLPNNPYERIDGWRQIAASIKANNCNNKQIYLFDDRDIAAEMSYYLQGCYGKIEYYNQGTEIKNYYQMKYPFTKEDDYLYFTTKKNKAFIANYHETKIATYSTKIIPNKNLEIEIINLKKIANVD